MSALASALTGVLAIVGTIVAKMLEQRTKRLQVELQAESDMRTQLLQRIDALEDKLATAIDREMILSQKLANLEATLRDKEAQSKELRLRYESLAEAHRELSERYKFSEQQNRKLRDEMLYWYMQGERRNTPVPPRYNPQDHIDE